MSKAVSLIDANRIPAIMSAASVIRMTAILWFCVLADAFLTNNGHSLSQRHPLNQPAVTVTTSVGEITGVTENVEIEGKAYVLDKFLGIPFAESPSGARRFQKPVPKAPFSEPFKATSEGPGCLQIKNLIPGKVPPLSEDCLLLNVFVPSGVAAARQEKMAVMVWVFGGGFKAGYSNGYNADTLSASGDVIVVTINYRLAEFGFFSTGDSNAPGNYGLWDQHLAFQWVNKNIESFGGDKSRVTIFGESAGAISVVYQALYEGNKGLFQRVIAESGSAISPRGFTPNPLDYAKTFAKFAGCDNTDISKSVECLRGKSAQELDVIANNPATGIGFLPWTPVLDGEFVKVAPTQIFDDNQKNSKAREMFSSVDLLTGVNSIEGSLLAGLFAMELGVKNIDDIVVSRAELEQKFIPEALVAYFGRNGTKDAINAAIYEYTSWSDPENDDIRRETLINMTSDYVFYAPTIKTINTHARNNSGSSTYFYRFCTRPSSHFLPVPSWMDGPHRANHEDDVPFVFGFDKKMLDYNFIGGYNVTAQERKVSTMMMTLWSNFAKSGDPKSPVDVSQLTKAKWLPFAADTQYYLELTPEMTSESLKQRLRARRYDLWIDFLPSLMGN